MIKGTSFNEKWEMSNIWFFSRIYDHCIKLFFSFIITLSPTTLAQMNVGAAEKILLTSNSLSLHFPNELILFTKIIHKFTSSCENYLMYCRQIPQGAAIWSPDN